MIRERTVKGPLDSVDVDGRTYRLEYRRRYYEPRVHFTWVEIEMSPGDPFSWQEMNPCFQSAPPQYNILKAKNIRQEVTNFVRRHKKDEQFIRDHFIFVHIGDQSP